MSKWKAANAQQKVKEAIYQVFTPLKNIPQPTREIYKVGELKDLENIDSSKPLFCDTETMKSYKGICMFQCMQAHWEKALVFLIKDAEKDLLPIYLKIKDCNVIFHNFSYDAASFANDLKLVECPFKKFEDTFYLARCIFWDNEYFNLEECYRRIFGFSPYESVDIDKKIVQKYFFYKKVDLDKIDEKVWLYSAIDVYYMPYVWRWLKHFKDTWHYKLDKRFIYHMIKWQQFGMPVDFEKLEAAKLSTKERINELQSLLPKDLNVNSPKQVRAFLNVESSARDEMNIIALDENNPRAKEAETILLLRKEMKTLNFLDRFSSERVRGYFNPSTKSGRAKCEGTLEVGEDNLLQVPRHLKQVFGFSSNSNKWLVYCDYAQLELRSATALLGEKNLRHSFDNELDLHKHTAALMFNIPYESVPKDKRQVAKQCNFALLYCASVGTLQQVFFNDGLKLSKDETQNLRTKWKNAYKAVKKWHEDSNKQYDSGRLDRITINGRHYLPKFFADMCGIENQSLGADAAKLATCLFCEAEPEARVLCFIHDAIIVEADSEEQGKRYAKSLGDAMVRGWFAAVANSKYPDLSMPLEVGLTKNLKTAEDLIVYETKGRWEDYKMFEEIKIEAAPKIDNMLVDADYILYIEAIEAEQNGESFEELCDRVALRFKALRETYNVSNLQFAITGSNVFRYEVDSNYKAKRHEREKPKYLSEIREWCKEFDNCLCVEELEADDICCAMKAQNPLITIASNDKDVLRGVAGRHYDLYHKRWVETSEWDAAYFHYFQALAGDSGDGIVGIPKVGEVKAKKILEGITSEAQLYARCLAAYEQNGLKEEDLIRNLRLILLNQYKDGQVKLWEPLEIEDLPF